jgi:SAM-dependent methyltransferase
VTFADHFSGVSAAYAAFRPRYPDALFNFLAGEAPARDAAWDAGTGSGQAALGLARYFAHVIATDASAAQIESATRHAQVEYVVAPAEAPPPGLTERSVDLVTVAQAVHWFDRARFWSEVRRVLRPRGIIAVWTYLLPEVAPSIDEIVRRFYRDTVGAYRPPERRHVDERYQSIEFPFAEIVTPEFAIEQPLNLDDFAGYIRTWSATRAYMRQRGEDPVERLIAELAPVWGPGRSRITHWPLVMRAGRV